MPNCSTDYVLRSKAFSHEGKQTVVSVFCPVNADFMFISVKSTPVCAFLLFSFYKPEAGRYRFQLADTFRAKPYTRRLETILLLFIVTYSIHIYFTRVDHNCHFHSRQAIRGDILHMLSSKRWANETKNNNASLKLKSIMKSYLSL